MREREMDQECDTTLKGEFQEPRKRFWLRSRKRPKSDAVSITSMDISLDSSDLGQKKKKRRRITEVASSIFSTTSSSSSSSSSSVSFSSTKLGSSGIHRSFSIQSGSSDLSLESDCPGNNAGSLVLRSWMLDVAARKPAEVLTRSEVKRQEAIYELFCGENVLLKDLYLLRGYYYEPLTSNGILSPGEMLTLFGDIDQLIDIHSSFRDRLMSLRDESGYTEAIGPVILEWLPLLKEPYTERCSSQVWAKHLLEEKRSNSRRFQSFLKKRLESPHSTDLWTYLDVPRSRIVKYPLLVKEILRHTPAGHPDQASLEKASGILSELLRAIDEAMGAAECQLAKSSIDVKSDCDPEECIKRATELVIEGPLKDSRGMKFHCFLFDTCFAVTRATRRRPRRRYSLAFPVTPSREVQLEAGERLKIGGLSLTTEDPHGRRHWVDAFKRMVRSIGTDIDKDPNQNQNQNQNQIQNTDSGSRSIENKENQAKPKRRSAASLSEVQFSLSLRKSLLKQKRHSIGFV